MKRDPFSGSLRYEVDRLFDHLVHTAWGGTRTVACLCPPVDVTAEPDRYRVEVDLPGVSTEEVEVVARGGVLHVEGQRPRHGRGPHTRSLLAELRYGRFARSLRLPADADAAGLRATFTDGVLTIEIPRRLPGGLR
jgi:HSP20 family protein